MGVEEMEQPAKRWEVAEVSGQLQTQAEMIKSMNTKLDVLIAQPHVTEKQIDDKIAIAIDKVHGKYGPMYDNAKWFNRAVIVAILAVLGDVAVQIWKLK